MSTGNTITINTSGATLSTTAKTNASAFTTVQGDTISTKAAYLVGTTISGGAGSDTVTVTDAVAATDFTTIFTSNDIETLNLGGGSTGLVVGGTNLTSINNTSATAASTVTLPAVTGASFTSSSSGVDTVTLGATNQSVSTGAGADVINTTVANSVGSTINGGADADTLNITGAGTASFAAGKLSGVETITLAAGLGLTWVSDQNATITDAGAATLAVTGNTMTVGAFAAAALNLSGSANYVVSGQTTGTITDTGTGTLAVTAGAAATTIVSSAVTSVDATALNNTLSIGGTGNYTVTGAGTAAIGTVTEAASHTTGTLTLTTAGANNFTFVEDAAGTGAVVLNHAGTQTLTVTALTGHGATTVNSSAANATVSNGAGTVNYTATGGTVVHTYTGSTTGVDNVTLPTTGGAADVVTMTGSNFNLMDTLANFKASGTDALHTGTKGTSLGAITIAAAEPVNMAAQMQTAINAAGSLTGAGSSYLVTINGGSMAGTYLFENLDAGSTVDATDFIVKLTGTTGSLLTADIQA